VETETPREDAAFRRTLGFARVVRIVQFLLGMAVTLFVTIPTDHPGTNPPEYFSGVVTSVRWAILHGGLWLALHAVWGLLLVLARSRWFRRSGSAAVGGSRWQPSAPSAFSAPASMAAASLTITKTSARC
jgi:hypothetical protein